MNNPFNMIKPLLSLLLFSALSWSCQNNGSQQSFSTSQKYSSDSITQPLQIAVAAYDLNNPEKCALPYSLIEISGLTLHEDDSTFYAVNDEKGLIYQLEACEIANRYDFGNDGDYEGIELVNNTMYIVKSNGKISVYDMNNQSEETIYGNKLTGDNDVEGLGYDPELNLLLLACKADAHLKKEKKLKNTRAVYAFDLESEALIEQPFLLITEKAIEGFLMSKSNEDFPKRLLNRALRFSPSAIAKHPVNGYYYLLSSVGKTMLVIDRENEIIDIQFLDPSSFTQPEGICFDRRGTMYISNEGMYFGGNVLRFNFNQ